MQVYRSTAESVRSALNLRFETNQEQQEQEQQKANTLLGKHLWDISEYDKLKVIKIYESDRLIVVLAKSHTSSPGDVAETVIGYLYESEEQQPKSYFRFNNDYYCYFYYREEYSQY